MAAIGLLGYGVSLVLLFGRCSSWHRSHGSLFFHRSVVGTALAFAMGQGQLDWAFIAAGILTSIGVWLHVTERHEHLHIHEPLEHEHLHYHDGTTGTSTLRLIRRANPMRIDIDMRD